MKFGHNNHSSRLQFVLLKFGIDIFDSLKLCVFRQRYILGNFKQFFHHNFRMKWKFLNLMVPSERSSSDLFFVILKIFSIYENHVLGVKLTFDFFNPTSQRP